MRRRGIAVAIDEQVLIGPHALGGVVHVPAGARGLVVFVHGSGSSRYSPRNRLVAEVLQSRSFGTLLFDLLTDDEAHDAANVFDIDLLAHRLLQAMRWTRERDDLQGRRLGLFGAGTGGAAARVAAAERPLEVSAVVSRGGRPDLAGAAVLARVQAPTLLLVGALDTEVLALNHDALRALHCAKRLDVVERATHLFEEAGALGRVADAAADWFDRHLAGAGS
jgi:putative phosphoribosyl transferase